MLFNRREQMWTLYNEVSKDTFMNGRSHLCSTEPWRPDNIPVNNPHAIYINSLLII